MKLKDRVLELAVKKLAKEATVEELQELDELLNQDHDAAMVVRILLVKWTSGEPVSKADIDRSFAKLMTRIKSVESGQITRTAASNYQSRHKKN